jgi:hypothetical protein
VLAVCYLGDAAPTDCALAPLRALGQPICWDTRALRLDQKQT